MRYYTEQEEQDMWLAHLLRTAEYEERQLIVSVDRDGLALTTPEE